MPALSPVSDPTPDPPPQDEDLFRALIDAVEDTAIFMTDPDGHAVTWNRGAEHITGYAAADMVGQHVSKCYPRDDVAAGKPDRALAMASANEQYTEEGWRVRRDGGRFWASVAMKRLTDATGKLTGFATIMRDMTERRRADEDLTRAADAGETGHLGAWWVDIEHPDLAANPLHWSDAVYRIFGYEPGGVGVTRDLFYGHVHPDDRDRVAAAMARALTSKEPYRLEHRIVRRDGIERTVLELAQVVDDERGRPRRIVGAVQDITERKRIERELSAARQSAERAKTRAEEANRAKDHFLAVLSHELRTPLTPVLTAIALLQKEPAASPRARAHLDIMRRNVELESRLIDDLLDLTRIARGKLEMDRRRFELATVVQRAIEVCRADIEARQLQFAVDFGPGPYVVEGDAARLQQVFWNVLKNAIKFTPHEGGVGVRCRPDDDGYVAVEILDSGIGIEPVEVARIFDAFTQAERSITKQFGGLGLGLAISKALVDAHGGTIEARSEGRDKGATFIIRLPTVPAQAGTGTPSRATAPPQAERAERRTLRILLVEDHGDTADMMVEVLEGDGHHVQRAGDVATALESALRARFDLLVSDLGLPDGSGLDLMQQLRARGSRLPGVAVSGYGHTHDIQRSRDAGFHAHLVKPVDPDRLLEAVDRAVNHRAAA
jgi:PAS domain S-box-containing protein